MNVNLNDVVQMQLVVPVYGEISVDSLLSNTDKNGEVLESSCEISDKPSTSDSDHQNN